MVIIENMKRKHILPWRKVANEGIVLSADKDEAHIFNETAMMIWEMLDGRNSIDEISARLCKEYNISKRAAVQDIRRFIGILKSKGLVE